MSASMSPTRWPCRASATARFTETVDFPTPPLPDETATTLPRLGSSTGVGGGGTAPGAGRAPGGRGCAGIGDVDSHGRHTGHALHRLAGVTGQRRGVGLGEDERERHLPPVVHG